METSNQKFIKWFLEYYDHEFPSLSKEFKHQKIQEILLNNAQFITEKQVIEFDACSMCGRCCEQQGCLDWDPETRRCTRHDNPIHKLCRTYPWTGDDLGIAPLSLNCNFAVAFFVDFFDKYFSTVIEDAS